MVDNKYIGKQWLPTTKKEIEHLGWDYIDVILFSGDAYIDHPSMGAAVIGRVLEAHGYRVAIVPQPNWRDDLRDFTKLGRPRLFFGVSAGAMDSMVNHYTANRRRRSDDAYTPNAKAGMRPDYPTIVYTEALKKMFPDVPVVVGGIEASMRRLSHYDYWQDSLRPSILVDCKADLLVYGMGEKPIVEIANALNARKNISELTDIPQTALLCSASNVPEKPDLLKEYVLHSHEECVNDKRKHAENFKNIEIESNKWQGRTLWQQVGKYVVKVNGTNPPMTQDEIDASFDLPYTRLPHPRYAGKRIPAYEMIRHSVNLHRGCFGGCSFCTISAHQGKFIASRSKASIMREVRQVCEMEDFKGYISDLGGPSANMYKLGGKDITKCKKCTRPSCLHPLPCPNLNNDHSALLDIYQAVDGLSQVKKSFIGSGVRYDLSMHRSDNEKVNKANRDYNKELIMKHVSGRLKVAPEHTSDGVLKLMRKPSFRQFEEFKRVFDRINTEYGLKQQLIPYFISSHPGCSECDMAELAVRTKKLNFHLEQVQDFTPTPMTMSTEMYYTGYNPYTMEEVFTARTKEDKLAQRKYFFWYDSGNKSDIVRSLHRLKRPDLIAELYPGGTGKTYVANRPAPRKTSQVKEPRLNKKKRNNLNKKHL